MKPKLLTLDQKSALCQIGHPKHLDSLIHDEDPDVRRNVARNGNDKHRDQLVHDEDPNVRWKVAEFGNENHARALLNDKNKDVKRVAKLKLKKLGKLNV